jgi:AcrR family transcriptional regulator
MGRFDSAQRTRILEAAISVFAERGFEGASIRLVGEAAGFNSALLYYYFENKDTLFMHAVRFVLRGFLDHLRAQPRRFASGRERVAFLVDGLFDYYGAHPARLRLMAVGLTLHARLVGKAIQELLQEQSLLPLEVLQEGMNQGQLRPMHPAQAWWCILGMCLYSHQLGEVLKHVDQGVLPLPLPNVEESRRQVCESLCKGLVLTSATGVHPQKSLLEVTRQKGQK